MASDNNSVNLGIDFFKSLNSNDKGHFGEKIVGFYLRDLLNNSPEKIFPIFNGIDSSDIYLPTPQKCYYSYLQEGGDLFELEASKNQDIKKYLLHEEGDREEAGLLKQWPNITKPWMPDVILRITNLYGDGDTEKKVLCEVKTGQYAAFRGDQRDVMEILNRSSDRLLLQARVLFDTKEDEITIRFKKLESTDLDDEIQWSTWVI